jgi:exopolysaccharide production protein ExoQ
MPPNLALLLCFIFVFIVYKIDLSHEKNISVASWISVIWMMYCLSKSLLLWLHPVRVGAIEELSISQGNPLDRNFLTVLMFISIIILIKRKINLESFLQNNSFLILLMVYILISVLWSENKGVAFKRYFRFLGDFIIVLVILTEKDPYNALCVVFRRAAYLLIPLSIVLIKYFPAIGIQYTRDGSVKMWAGVTTHKNCLGILTLVSGIFFLYSIIKILKKEKKISVNLLIYIFYLLMILFLLKGSGDSTSSTSLLLFVIGSFILFGFLIIKSHNEKYVSKYFIIAVIIIIVFQWLMQFFIDKTYFQLVLSIFGRNETLTGRTDLWDELIAMGQSHLLLGTGYGSFWLDKNLEHLWAIFWWQPTQSHNGYIETFINLGLFGIFFLVLFFIASFNNITKEFKFNNEFNKVRFTFFVIILFHNYSEASLLLPNNPLWVLLIAICVVVPKCIDNSEYSSKLVKN